MSLRFKMSLLALASLIMLLVIYAILQPIILNGFRNAENGVIDGKLKQANAILDTNISNLDKIATDWAQWDDTYNFIIDQNVNYVSSNLIDSTFVNNHINLIVYVSLTGEIVFNKAYDLNNDNEIQFPDSIAQALREENRLLVSNQSDRGAHGIISIGGQPAIIVSEPILKSTGEGPSRGTLIFGRFLNPDEVSTTMLNSGLTDNVEIKLINDKLSPNYKTALTALEKSQNYDELISENSIAGYMIIKDIFGKSLFILRIETQRPINELAIQTTSFFSWTYIIFVICLICFQIFYNEKMVVSRIAYLIKHVKNIGTTGGVQNSITIKGTDDISSLAESINSMVKRINDASKAIETSEQQYRELADTLRKTLDSVIGCINTTIKLRDPYTAMHQERVALLARAIASDMGLPTKEIDQICTAAALHDIGKINIPSEILCKPNKLSEIEYAIIKTHSQTGYNILKNVEFQYPLAEWVLQHHELMDGSGYPNGLSRNQIGLAARIIAVADVCEATSSDRPYRAALGIEVALQELKQYKNIRYDEKVVDSCLRIFNEQGFKFQNK